LCLRLRLHLKAGQQPHESIQQGGHNASLSPNRRRSEFYSGDRVACSELRRGDPFGHSSRGEPPSKTLHSAFTQMAGTGRVSTSAVISTEVAKAGTVVRRNAARKVVRIIPRIIVRTTGTAINRYSPSPSPALTSERNADAVEPVGVIASIVAPSPTGPSRHLLRRKRMSASGGKAAVMQTSYNVAV
jgi:hypothetical protein